MGARILNGAIIKQHSIVGAGAVVTQGKTFPGWNRLNPRDASPIKKGINKERNRRHP